MEDATRPTRTAWELFGDMAELVARALVSGIAAAVTMALAILALSATAQAAALEPWSAALAPDVDRVATGAGALWANANAVRRSDAPMDLPFAIVALVATGLTVVAARRTSLGSTPPTNR